MTATLASLQERGLLAPRVTKVHAFADVPAALTELDERRAIGKHVVRVSH
jgi:NADPH:quinone reductase-like Zn-dependent oxidoreductase